MALITIPLLGFAPDLDPQTPGALTYARGMQAAEYGWVIAPSQSSGNSTLSVAANSYLRDGYAALNSAGDKVVTVAYYDGTATAVKLLATKSLGSTLTDVSRAANYSVTTNVSMAQFGVYTLATNLTDLLQIRDSSSDANIFANTSATGIPKAKIVVTWGPPNYQRVMLLHYNDGTDYPAGYWSGHKGGPTLAWTPDVATEATNGDLRGAGVITCGIAFGNDIIAFSDNSMWIGRLVPPPVVVKWDIISDKIGCVGMYAACVANGVLYFLSPNGLYSFNGSSLPQLMPVPVQSYMRSLQSGVASTKRWITLVTDAQRNILQVAFRLEPTAGSTIYSLFRINLSNNLAGADLVIVSGHKLWLDENITFTISGSNVVTSNANNTINQGGTSLSDLIGIGLNYVGNDHADTKILRVIPRFAGVLPYQYSMINTYAATSGELAVAVGAGTGTDTTVTVTATPWRADQVRTARWHRPLIYLATNTTSSPIVADVMLEVEKAGEK